MNISDLKNIVGEAKAGETATIRFFGKITEESTRQFNNEFDYLENYVRPSLIRILINSEGGSVLHGMSTYSTIQNSSIETECINEGMAASMGSILWAAGNRSLMRDYSILMIHNPFLPDNEDGSTSDLLQAFTQQITTIYRKRFGLKKEQVQAIMKGEAGKDGTYFDAKSAVKAGIIPTESVLHTSKQLCEKVKNELSALEDTTQIQDLMARISMEAPDLNTENNHLEETIPNPNKIHKNQAQMTEEKTQSLEYAAVAASLGMKDNYQVKDVMTRISELIGVESKLTEVLKANKDSQTIIAGKDATILNLQNNVTELNASLDVYKNKEAEVQKAKIDALVESAVAEGKIDMTAKEQWVEMGGSNFDLAQSILASIPAREQISKEIAKGPNNVQAAADGAKTVEEKVSEKVVAVVGKEFEFKTLK